MVGKAGTKIYALILFGLVFCGGCLAPQDKTAADADARVRLSGDVTVTAADRQGF